MRNFFPENLEKNEEKSLENVLLCSVADAINAMHDDSMSVLRSFPNIFIISVTLLTFRIEALICLLAYTAYGLVMAFNRRLEAAFKAITGIQDLDDPVEIKEAPCKH